MNMKLKNAILLITLTTALVFSSCKKNEDPTLSSDAATAAQDNAIADQTFSDSYDITVDGIDRKPGLNKTDATAGITAIISDSVLVTFDSQKDSNNVLQGKFPVNLTVAFKPTGSYCKDGRIRMGKIHIKLENTRFALKGSVTTVTLENYKVNGNAVEGKKVITNDGPNSAGNNVYTVNVTDAKITKTDGKVITWASTRKNEVVLTPQTKIISHIYITGSANGVNSNAKKYTINITKPIKIQRGCNYVTEGTLDLKPEGGETWTVDYGNGTCDNKATITVLGKTFDFEMKR